MAFSADLSKAHYDINKINKSFLMAEHVDLASAEALVKKPRLVTLVSKQVRLT
jgi:hypothetical protein